MTSESHGTTDSAGEIIWILQRHLNPFRQISKTDKWFFNL